MLHVHVVKKLVAVVHNEEARNERPESSKKNPLDKERNFQDPRTKDRVKNIDLRYTEMRTSL